MSKSIKLGCACGEVEGVLEVHRQNSFHVECLCCDCQKFAKHLQNENVLKSYGGTELLQTYPSYMKITKGEDKISCMRLSPNGLLRHYTSCCKTPVGNMMAGAKMPFVGIPVAFMKFEAGQEKDKILGPISMKAFGKYAIGKMPEDAHERFPMSYMPRILYFILKGKFQKKYEPSPYFKDGKHNIAVELAPKTA